MTARPAATPAAVDQHLLAVTFRPIDPGGTALGDQRGVEFGRGRIGTGQGRTRTLGIGFERQDGGIRVPAIGYAQHPRMLARRW